jgi:DNA-binding NarL/FixJ family response regulator
MMLRSLLAVGGQERPFINAFIPRGDHMLRVVLADPRPLVRAGLRTVLDQAKEVDLLSEDCTPATLQRYCDRQSPDILILSVHFAGVAFHRLVATLHRRHPQLYILLLSDYEKSEIDYQQLLLDWSNIKGIISLHEPAEAWLAALQTIGRGNIWLSQPRMDDWVRQSRQAMPSTPSLSRREFEVLQLVAEGLTNKEIARKLKIVERTVEFHINNILQKLQVASRVEAALWLQAR